MTTITIGSQHLPDNISSKVCSGLSGVFGTFPFLGSEAGGGRSWVQTRACSGLNSGEAKACVHFAFHRQCKCASANTAWRWTLHYYSVQLHVTEKWMMFPSKRSWKKAFLETDATCHPGLVRRQTCFYHFDKWGHELLGEGRASVLATSTKDFPSMLQDCTSSAWAGCFTSKAPF